MEAKDPFAILCDKLQVPHPLLQRLAVSSIFQRLAAAPVPDAAMQSGSGKEALMRCLSSPQACIVDQSVRELCSLAKSGKISLAQAAMILQSSLDSVASSTVQVLVCGIGFLCRLHVAGHDNTISVNPLLKAIQSREEASTAILQQVRLVLLHCDQGRAMRFIQPFLTHVFMEPSRLRSKFARQLHLIVCGVSVARPGLGAGLMKLLIQYSHCRFPEFPEDIDLLCEEIQELVDVLEEASPSSEIGAFGIPVLELVFGLWYESKVRCLPSLPFASLVQRISLLECLSDKHQSLDVYLSALSYFLAVAELEQEQLLILALAQSWLEKDTSRSFSLQSLLCWIFPTLHVLTSPSGLVKQSATLLLGKIECLLNDGNSEPRSSATPQPAVMPHELVYSLWESDETDVRTWFNKLTISDSEFPVLLAILITALSFHSSSKISRLAIDNLAALGRHHTVWGVSLFPVFLFSLKYHQRHDANSNVVVALLSALPEICRHSSTLPMSMHLLQHMNDYKENLRIQAASIRLIYKVWQRTGRAYSILQRTLVPSWFTQADIETDLLLSRAISLRDLCGHDPDAGIDLIQSVQACIENRSPLVKSLGLQSLSFLCGDDVIDFYTAWKVIAKLFTPLPESNSVSESFSMLLKHGALDASTNYEDAHTVLNMLWELSYQENAQGCGRTRSAAVDSLRGYEVELLKETMAYEGMHVNLLIRSAESAAKVQCEKLIVKFLEHEHNTRQRATADKINVTKVERILESLPRTFSNSTRTSCPGYLLFFWITSKENLTAKHASFKADAEAFQRNFSEVTRNLNASGDLIIALLSLFSWSFFVPQWIKRGYESAELACNQIAKICMDASEEESPRVCENSTLALAALSRSVRQPSSVSSSVAKHFQLKVSSVAHQSAVWSAAMALGVLTTSLHPTDWDVKVQAVQSLIQSASEEKSGFVVGSASMALGFACQSLFLSGPSSMDNTKENEMLSDVLLCVLKMLALRCPRTSPVVHELARNKFFTRDVFVEGLDERCLKFEEDNFWASIGLVWALGNSVTALARAGRRELVKEISQAVFSWTSVLTDDTETMSLAAGASLVLPTCVEASDRLELLDPKEIEVLVKRLGDSVRRIIDLPQSKRSSQPWLAYVFMATCIGYGGLVAKVLQTGAHLLENETVTSLLETLYQGYTQMEGAHYCFGAMLGLANALGANVTSDFEPQEMEKRHSQSGDKVTTPLMYSSAHEDKIRAMVQHIVRISHSSNDQRLRDYASWCLAIMHTSWRRMNENLLSAKDGEAPSRATLRWSYQPVGLTSLPKDNTLRLLCEWLSSIGLTKVGVPCPEVIAVMRCLEEAPRLPMQDWTGLMRRIMQHKEWFTGLQHGEVRERCFILSLRHADRVPPLASVVDELCEVSKLLSLEEKLQMVVLGHLGELHKVFSLARMERLLAEFIQVLRKLNNSKEDHARDCRIECWKGLTKFWETDTKDLLVHVENFMRHLTFMSLGHFSGGKDTEETEEWTVALDCLKHARASWLLDVFEIKDDENFQAFAIARCRLAAMKVLPVSSLKTLRSQLINQRLTGQWTLMTECSLALKTAEPQDQMEWLLDTMDAAYLSKFPSTAISFVALFASSWSPDSYLFSLDASSVLRQLPSSLQKLTAQKQWHQTARSLATKTMAVVERLAKLCQSPEAGSLDDTKELFQVMHRVAMSMKEYSTPGMLMRVAELSLIEFV